MADMPGFGKMNVDDRGGPHEFNYADDALVEPSPGPTPSQTVGPFFAHGLTPGSYAYPLRDIHSSDMVGPDVHGDRITIEGYVYDANGDPVHDAVVEIIQADSSGRYVAAPRNDGFTGFGRCGTGSGGPADKGGDTRFVFRTIKPGASEEGFAPSINVILFMRGLLNHCITRIYFPEDALESDPIFAALPAERRDTLIACAIGPGRYRFDIHIRGEKETVFFDV